MIDKQVLINLMRKRKDRNLQAIQRYAPHLMDLVNRKGKVSCGIYIGDNGQIDLMMEGQRVYNMDPRLVAQMQFENFKKQRENLFVIPSVSSGRGHIDDIYKEKVVELFGQKPDPEKLKKAVEEELKEGQKLGALLSVGLGFGYHLELLTKAYDIRYLLVVEKDPEVFKTSLYTADWEMILRHYSENARVFLLFVGDDPAELSKHMVYVLGNALNTPMLYFTPIFIHLFGPFYEQVGRHFSERINELVMGWGFVQDELWSLEYTLENIKKELPLYQAKKKVPSDSTAFVIGAGPSLEYALDFIKKNQERAVIFSCGSSIGTLYEEGIKPDFHVEIERTKFTYDALLQSASRDYLKELTVIFNNPMYPQVSELFKESLMFVKPNDTGGSLFPPEYPPVGYSNPTVVNAGLSLALHMGFKRVYLFGVDMGYKDPRKHHAKGNVALKEGSEFYKESEAQEHELEGNFGGKVYTNSMLLWARSMIQDLLKLYKDAEVFNTSDGAKIEGTIPARIDELSLSKFKKSEVVKLIKQDFSRKYAREDYIRRRLEDFMEDMQEFEALVERLFSANLQARGELVDALNFLYGWLYSQSKTGILFKILRGGFMQVEHLYLFLSHQEGKHHEECQSIIKSYLLEALERTKALIEPFLVSKTLT